MIENYPEYYTYFKETSFTWDRTGGDPIKQGNRNPLLYKDIGADGIKTGFLEVEQYSLAVSAKAGKRRVTVIGSGFKKKNSRSRESTKILNWGMKNKEKLRLRQRKNGEKMNLFRQYTPLNTRLKSNIFSKKRKMMENSSFSKNL